MKPLEILVVDDEPSILVFVQATLESMGYRVQTALCNSKETAQIIVRKVGEHHFSVAIIGTVMPGMNGVELAEQISRISPLTKLVLAIEDACVDGARLLRAKGLRVESLRAPFEREELRLLLASLVEPSPRAMAFSFWIIVPLALAAAVWTYAHLSTSIFLRAALSVFVLAIAISLLGTISTLILARLYRIDMMGNAVSDRRRQQRDTIDRLMDFLKMDEAAKTSVRRSLTFGTADEEQVRLHLEQKMRNAKPSTAARCEITDEDIPF